MEPLKVNKWLPKFRGNNVITVKDRIYVMGRDMDNAGIDHEDVATRLFASSFTEEALDWFRGLPDNHIMTYDAFSNLFKSRWLRKADGGTLGTQFNQIKKKENEMVREFISIFDRLYSQIPTNYCPTTSSVRLLYMNAFEGQFRYILKDKNPTPLAEVKEFSIDIEENLLDSKIEPFQYPRSKTESRTKVFNNNVPDPIALLTQKINQMNTQFV
jgi:hypothetical protein